MAVHTSNDRSIAWQSICLPWYDEASVCWNLCLKCHEATRNIASKQIEIPGSRHPFERACGGGGVLLLKRNSHLSTCNILVRSSYGTPRYQPFLKKRRRWSYVFSAFRSAKNTDHHKTVNFHWHNKIWIEMLKRYDVRFLPWGQDRRLRDNHAVKEMTPSIDKLWSQYVTFSL